MRTSTTFSILFWIYTKRASNNHAGIYARLTVNGKRVNISLKQKVNIDKWDSKKQKVKGTSSESRAINLFLDQTKSNLLYCYQELKFKGELITAQLIKAHYLGETETSKTLQDILKYHNKKIVQSLAPGTVKNFEITEGYVNKFLKSKLKTTDIHLNQLDYKFICDFENFLQNFWPKGHPKAMGQNTVMKHIQRLRKIIRLSFHLEWLNKDPFLRWKPIYEKTYREYLNKNELSNLETYLFPIERLERVKDLFVFSCYTGISYIDIMGLIPSNIQIGIDGNNWIIIKRQKTKTPVRIPLLDQALRIIEKYKNHPITQVTGSLLPQITNEKLNVYLKEVALLCGIKKNLTFHMARHTFATTITLSNGVPIETVSKLLGHTKIATTQIYAKVLEQKVSEDMQILRNKISFRNEGNKIKYSNK